MVSAIPVYLSEPQESARDGQPTARAGTKILQSALADLCVLCLPLPFYTCGAESDTITKMLQHHMSAVTATVTTGAVMFGHR